MAPSSVSTASTVTRGPVTLPLFKFSHCTSPNPQAKMIWTHLPQRSDMFAVFDVIRKIGTGMVVSETKTLKLVRGGELLVSMFSRRYQSIFLTSAPKEQVELSNLQDQVRMDEERALFQHVPDNLLNVLVIVKRPLLALRYTLASGQIRKTQMNFVPFSGCDIALENFRAAGLPIRDKDSPPLQSQRQQSSWSQPHSREQPDSLNARQNASPQSSQAAFPGSSQPMSQDGTRILKTGYGSMAPSTQPTRVDIRPTSAPGGVKKYEFSRPISASSGSTLNASGSTITVTSVPTIAEPRTQSGLLPSPVFNGTYEPFGSFQVRPMSAPEPTQTHRGNTDTLPRSQMPPPERILPCPENRIHLFRKDEAKSQDEPSQEKTVVPKTKAKRQTKPRAQPAKPRKTGAKIEAAAISSDSLAPSSSSTTYCAKMKAPSPNAPQRLAPQQLHAIPPLSEQPASPSINSRKHSLLDHSAHQPNKRQAQIGAETVAGAVTEPLVARAVAEQPPQAQPSRLTDLLIDNSSRVLLERIDNAMRKHQEALTNNLMRKYHDLPEVKSDDGDDSPMALDKLVCECSGNESFWMLMEAIEGAWKRTRPGS